MFSRIFNKSLAIWVVIALVLQLALGFAHPGNHVYAATVVNVKDYGAKGDGVTNDVGAINQALAEALDSSGPVTVIVPDGTYMVGSYLRIYSNTTLKLSDGATIKANKSYGDGDLLKGLHFGCSFLNSNCNHGGYSQIHDITIEGGTWDRAASGKASAQMFRLSHGKNITIRNTKMLNAADHFINISASKNVTIKNVDFRKLNYSFLIDTYGDDYQSEAIHTDAAHSGEPGLYPQDGTVCDGIVVDGCHFERVDCGIGTHYYGDNMPMHGTVTIKNCTFKNITGRPANFYRLKGTMENCTAENVEMLVMVREASAVVKNNNVKKSYDVGIKLYEALAKTVVEGNTVENAASHGIFCEKTVVSGSSDIQIKNNTVKKSGRKGISIYRSKTITVSENTVLDSVEHGIHVNGDASNPSLAIVTGNTSLNPTNIDKYPDIGTDSYSKGCTIKNNVIGIRGILDNSGNAKMSGNTFQNNTKWKRLSGLGRYDTMKTIVNEGWSNTGGTVVVATGAGFKDALAAAGLAGLYGAPLVLTDGKVLSTQASSLIKTLKPKRVLIAGGEAAVSKTVFNKIKSISSVTPTRYYGKDSVQTSVKLALAGKGKWSSTAIIATNKSFKDALSVAPISYTKKMPIFLVSGGSMTDDALKAMKTLGINKVIIVGGTLAVPKSIENQLKAKKITVTKRLAGANGVETSKLIAAWGIQNGMNANKMGVATSVNFPDALAGAALCGKNKSVLVLADDKNLANASFPKSYAKVISKGYIFGGEAAVGMKTHKQLAIATEV